MVLYTPLVESDIFPHKDDPHEVISYQGKSLYCRKNEQGDLQLIQLLSTDPQDFLQAKFSPGTIVKNEFSQK